jgi:integrase
MSNRRGNNEGTIAKRSDGRWEARVYLPDGKRKCYYGKTRQEVARKMTQALRAKEQGMLVVDERQTIEQYLSSWLEKMKHIVRYSTWIRYQNFVRHVVPIIGRVSLAKLAPQHLQALYTTKLDEGLSPTTVNHLHAMLHKVFDDALRLGLVPRNITDMVDPPRMNHHQITTLSPTEAKQLLKAAHGDRLEALYVLALSTGMRQGELLALRWHDVDLDNSLLHVWATLQFAHGQFVFSEPKTTYSRRRVRLSRVAVKALEQHRINQLTEREKVGDAWDESFDLVFPNSIGRPFNNSNLIIREFAPLLERARLPRIRFHDLRHTAATLLLLRGINPKVVSEMLGHSHVSITLALYSHVIPDMQQAAADTMDAVLRD